ncbi:hypothetical protein [Mammaliicoccus sp. H-M34]|uniref:hypothetical protein n=1 Tax=Mammaliicoccus sp. H-M34 TaxID=2898693 RepID=UPI001EFBE7C3|nr:hypothetical protein [Mammaliicoccus sp. H-M34]
MKKASLFLSIYLLIFILAACGKQSDEIQGSWASSDKVFIVDDEKIMVFYKDEKEKPYTTIYYTIVNEGDYDLTVDVSDEKDDEPYSRQKWYVDHDGALKLYMDNNVIEAFPYDADSYGKEQTDTSTSVSDVFLVTIIIICSIAVFFGISKAIRIPKVREFFGLDD